MEEALSPVVFWDPEITFRDGYLIYQKAQPDLVREGGKVDPFEK